MIFLADELACATRMTGSNSMPEVAEPDVLEEQLLLFERQARGTWNSPPLDAIIGLGLAIFESNRPRGKASG